MGNLSNLATLRPNSELRISEFNIKSYFFNFLLSKYIQKSLNNKNIFVQRLELLYNHNILSINVSCFFSTKKTNFYRSLFKIKKKRKFFKANRNNLMFFRYVNSKFKMITFSLKVLNRFVNMESVLFFYLNLKKFRGLLFGRKINLFYDFIKITSLFSNFHVSINSFLYYISELFCFLIKKKHNSFLFFLKTLFNLLLSNNKCQFAGLRFLVSGKLSGKPRSSSHKILAGSVPLQSINKNIQMAKSHVYTIYGVFGFKIWVCKK